MQRTSSRSRVPRARFANDRRGLTVVELVVAIVLLTIGLLGLAAVSASILRQMRVSGHQAVATALASSRFEQFEGKPCAQITAGSATSRGVTETWSVSPVGSRGMTINDTLSFRGYKGTTRKVGLMTVVSCS